MFKLPSFLLNSDAFSLNLLSIGRIISFYIFVDFNYIVCIFPSLFIWPIFLSIMYLLFYMPIKICMLPRNGLGVTIEINTV